MVVIGFLVQQRVEEAPKIFELVAGEGDNYMATAAPALGTPDGIKVTIPEPVVVKAAPVVEPVPEPVVERAPVTPAKAAPPKVTPVEPIRDFSKDVKRISTKRQKRLEAEDKRLRAIAEKKEKAAAAAAAKRMTKEEFDRLNKSKSKSAAPKSATPPKIAKIDGVGIAKGVVGGSTANKVGGAGGKALTRDEGDALDLYFSLLKRRLKEALDKPPGLSDSLVAVVEVRIAANGLLSGAKVTRSSGSADFDHAALAAIARVRSIGPRPDGKSEVLSIPFLMKEEDGG